MGAPDNVIWLDSFRHSAGLQQLPATQPPAPLTADGLGAYPELALLNLVRQVQHSLDRRAALMEALLDEDWGGE